MEMTRTKSTIQFETKNKNKYLYDRRLRKFVISHPILHFLVKMREMGHKPDQWLAQQKSELVSIGDYGTVSREEIAYYCQKIKILENNGYFSSIQQKNSFVTKVTEDDIIRILSNIQQLTLELTDACNLNCKYCAFGQFYSNFDKRENKMMDFSVGKRVIDYLHPYLNSSHNQPLRPFFIGFYGGEPLLNFPLIKDMVHYVNSLNWTNNRIRFLVTTNGVLLNKYMNFLIEHDFDIYISLDGDESNNEYRVFQNGKSSYHNLLNSLQNMQRKYGDFFKRKVFFLSVLHNKNSVGDIFNYFKTKFNKQPIILQLNTSNVREDKADEFWKTYVNVNESLYNSEDYTRIEKEMFIGLPNIQDLSAFLFNSMDSCFDDYKDLLYSQKSWRYPTGTCLPFSKKMFVTVNGKILACERIGQSFTLGHADHKGVVLDLGEIAEKFTRLFDNMRKQCAACYYADQCRQCIFYLTFVDGKPVCRKIQNEKNYAAILASNLDLLEKKPDTFDRILKEVVFG